ncbi:MAG: hypothetical protein ABIG28_01835 [archaeon]
MGLLNILKKIFSESQEEETKSLTLNQLESLLEELSKETFDGTNEKLSEIKEQIAREKVSLNSNLSLLENAKLKNTEIPDRVKQVMEGNRQAYIQKMSSILEKVSPPQKFSELIEFTNSFDNELANFEKSIAKNHHIMLEFFVKEATAVSTNIRNIDKLAKDIKKTLEENKINSLEKIKTQLNEIKIKIKQDSKAKQNIAKKKEELEKKSAKISERESEIKKLKESKDYEEFLAITNYKQTAEKELSNTNASIIHSFSEIETALKKYSNLDKEDKLVKCYLDNPIKTLIEDKEFNIISIINSTKNSIENNKINLKDKKKEKTLRGLDDLTEQTFKDFLKKHEKLNTQISDLSSQIDKSNIAKKVKDLKGNLEQEKMKILEEINALFKLKKNLEDFNLNDLKSELENEITLSLGKKVKIA